MKGARRHRCAIVGAAAVLLLASGLAVAAPTRISLVVHPQVVSNMSQRLAIHGSVDNGRADQKVVVQFKACGLVPVQFRDAFETMTEAGGRYSLESLQPFTLGVSGVFRAVSGDSVSAEVPVYQRASVFLRRVGSARFQAGVSAMVPFWRRFVVLQRYERGRGGWVVVRRLVLDEQLGGTGGPAPPFARRSPVTVRTDPFRPGVRKGSRIRVAFPLSQAQPCYLAAMSDSLGT